MYKLKKIISNNFHLTKFLKEDAEIDSDKIEKKYENIIKKLNEIIFFENLVDEYEYLKKENLPKVDVYYDGKNKIKYNFWYIFYISSHVELETLKNEKNGIDQKFQMIEKSENTGFKKIDSLGIINEISLKKSSPNKVELVNDKNQNHELLFVRQENQSSNFLFYS